MSKHSSRMRRRGFVCSGMLRRRTIAGALFVTLAATTSVWSVDRPLVVESDKTKPFASTPKIPDAAASPSCQAPRDRTRQLVTELEDLLRPEAKTAGQQYVAKPGPGVSTEKAWGNFAAGAALIGYSPLAAWASLNAADLKWAGDTVTNVGIYLFHLGKTQDSLQFLTCALAMGHRSPYLLEALSTAHHKLGHTTEARHSITAAFELAPDDRLIETSSSFLNTGQPPPPDPPSRMDGLDEALRQLTQHGVRILNQIKLQADTIDQNFSDRRAAEFYEIARTYVDSLVRNSREQAASARAADPRARQVMINNALSGTINAFAQMTDTLLRFPNQTQNLGSPLLFWAEVLDLDPAILAREGRSDGPGLETYSTAGPPLAQGALDTYEHKKQEGYDDYLRNDRACRDMPCKVRAKAHWCSVWKPIYEEWATRSRQRFNKAARSFDRVATQAVLVADNELLLTRDFAVRQVKNMKFDEMPGVDFKGMTLQGVNMSLQGVFETHLGAQAEESHGTVAYVREEARWFEEQRHFLEDRLAHEAEDLKRQCEPALQALLELLIQEQWEAYLDHLRDRIAWDIQGQAETSEFPCEGSIGPVRIGTDLNKPGEGKFDLKWARKGVPVSVSGSATLRQDQTFGLGVGVSYKGGPPGGVSRGGSGTVRDQLGKSGIGGEIGYGPFAGKASVTYTTKQSPWNSRDYLGIKLKGSAGLGLKAGTMGVACYPSSGSVTFYPRALYEDTVRYLSTPRTPPR